VSPNGLPLEQEISSFFCSHCITFTNIQAPLNPIHSYLFSKVPSKREREKEAEAPRKVQKILGATSVSGTRIFETIAENSGARLGEKVRTSLHESGVA
jgi:hypothetical protein